MSEMDRAAKDTLVLIALAYRRGVEPSRYGSRQYWFCPPRLARPKLLEVGPNLLMAY
jgi:hypothetical protein